MIEREPAVVAPETLPRRLWLIALVSGALLLHGCWPQPARALAHH